jgi:hypothetical protein
MTIQYPKQSPTCLPPSLSLSPSHVRKDTRSAWKLTPQLLTVQNSRNVNFWPNSGPILWGMHTQLLSYAKYTCQVCPNPPSPHCVTVPIV